MILFVIGLKLAFLNLYSQTDFRIKKETGSTALDYIQSKVIDEAKEKIFEAGKSINEIAGDLGFKYQQHFIRLFKQKTGVTPNEYRSFN